MYKKKEQFRAAEANVSLILKKKCRESKTGAPNIDQYVPKYNQHQFMC